VPTPQTRPFPLKEQEAKNLFFPSKYFLGPPRCPAATHSIILDAACKHGNDET